MERITFEGKKIDINQISHQHLSNIYWFSEIINVIPCDKFIWDRIKKEFNGEILPYLPKSSFKEEIDILDKLGYLFWKEVDGVKIADIVYKGKVIGNACHQSEQREIIINSYIKGLDI